MNTKELVLQDFELHKGEFIIIDDKVVRLIAITTDEFDYYYLVYDGRMLKNYTCLIGFTPLKNKIDVSDYDKLIRSAKLNHDDQIDNDIKLELINKCESSGGLLTELCWDLN